MCLVPYLCSCSVSYEQQGADFWEFIIGEWSCEIQVEDENGIYTKHYLVDFVDEDTVFLNVSSSIDGIRAKFEYEFIDEETISVENDRLTGGEWQISRSGEDLFLCIWNAENCMIFNRVDE